MTHPITPPPELIEQWREDMTSYEVDIVRAAQWGADMELEACCETSQSWGSCIVPDLRAVLAHWGTPAIQPVPQQEVQ